MDAFESLHNPFLEDSGNLIDLDQSVIMPQEVVDSVRNVKAIGENKYREFVVKRIGSQQEPLTASLSQTSLKLFKSAFRANEKKLSEKASVADMKHQQTKVVDILTAYQAGRMIEETVLSHECSMYPPSLKRKGLLHTCVKSEILECISSRETHMDHQPGTSAVVLEGSVLVHLLRPGHSVYFKDYIDQVFGPHIILWFGTHQREDVIFDTYRQGSLKAATHEKRGKGTRRRVKLSTKVPGNWASFLRVNENKQELFALISKRIMETLQVPEVSRT